ncbi:hypothetical protein SAMN04487934_101357 [Eubacterium ruminantium]|nr:hypothetical protein SAMN04487934_101357 [Eubacterium ruminantium]
MPRLTKPAKGNMMYEDFYRSFTSALGFMEWGSGPRKLLSENIGAFRTLYLRDEKEFVDEALGQIEVLVNFMKTRDKKTGKTGIDIIKENYGGDFNDFAADLAVMNDELELGLDLPKLGINIIPKKVEEPKVEDVNKNPQVNAVNDAPIGVNEVNAVNNAANNNVVNNEQVNGEPQVNAVNNVPVNGEPQAVQPAGFKFGGKVTKMMFFDSINPIMTMMDLFDNVDEVQTAGLAVVGLAQSSKEKYDNVQLPEADVQGLSVAAKEFLDAMDRDIAADNRPDNSYIKRAKKAFRRHVEAGLNGDIQLMLEADDSILLYKSGTFNDYPLPNFNVAKQGEPLNLQRDEQKYEEFMAKYPFLEQFEDRQQYDETVKIPFLKAKKSGLVDEKLEREYKSKTLEHLKRQKVYFEQLQAIPVNEETLSIEPFAKLETGLTMDWKGERYGKMRGNQIEREIRALEHGWSPEDFQLFHDVDTMMKTLTTYKDTVDQKRPGMYDQVKRIYDDFNKAYIDTPADRRRVLGTLKPIYSEYKKHMLTPELKKKDVEYAHVSGIVGKYEDNYKRISKNDVSVVTLSADERFRQEMIKSLEDYMKELSAQHSVGSHTDTQEMRFLKGAVVNALTVLKDNRDKGIFEWDKYAEVFDRIEENAKIYREEKLKDYARKVRKENPVPDNATKEQKEEIEDRIREKLENWEPNTKMGVKRYKAALGLADDARLFAKKLRTGKVDREKLKEEFDAVKAAGHDIVWKADIRYRQGRPYNGGVWQLLNFCGKNPAYTPEHTFKANRMYDKEQFLNTFKPVQLDGISSDDFAVITYAKMHDTSFISQGWTDTKFPTKSPESTKELKLRQARTMYTLDMGISTPRAGMAENFLGDTLVPAKDFAKQAFEKYKSGDSKELVDIIATGIKEINGDCIKEDLMDSDNYGMQTEMLSKLIDFAQKDEKLYSDVMQKLDQETRLSVEDTIRLKGIQDKAFDAENKLKRADELGIKMTDKEKKACIKDIVRWDFVSTMHNRKRAEQRDNSKEFEDFQKNRKKLIKQTAKPNADITVHDTIVMEYKILEDVRKPVPHITRRLRTEKGNKMLEDAVKNISSNISSSDSPKKILESLKKNKEEFVRIHNKQRNKALEQKKATEAKAAPKNQTAPKAGANVNKKSVKGKN